jgi:8-oxo-dGTP diphosphatase
MREYGQGRRRGEILIQRVVVCGLLMKSSKILILRRRDDEKFYAGMWELPSGKVEYGEDPILAVAREFKEETNLSVKVGKPIRVSHYTVEDEKDRRHTVKITFMVDLEKEGRIKTTEHSNFAWIGPTEIGRYDIIEDVKEDILTAFFDVL